MSVVFRFPHPRRYSRHNSLVTVHNEVFSDWNRYIAKLIVILAYGQGTLNVR